MELIQQVSSLTSDDSLVVVVVQRIFDTYSVRLLAAAASGSIGHLRDPD
jgi:hypothetical protein